MDHHLQHFPVIGGGMSGSGSAHPTGSEPTSTAGRSARNLPHIGGVGNKE
jgi:hypothetical protein